MVISISHYTPHLLCTVFKRPNNITENIHSQSWLKPLHAVPKEGLDCRRARPPPMLEGGRTLHRNNVSPVCQAFPINVEVIFNGTQLIRQARSVKPQIEMSSLKTSPKPTNKSPATALAWRTIEFIDYVRMRWLLHLGIRLPRLDVKWKFMVVCWLETMPMSLSLALVCCLTCRG